MLARKTWSINSGRRKYFSMTFILLTTAMFKWLTTTAFLNHKKFKFS